jgi:ketosteroid isomerase-like protein
MGNADVIRELTRRWNSGDLDGALELYNDDAEMRTGAHWPEATTYRGREEIRATTEDWASMWEKVQIELDSLEEHGDKIVATGSWVMRGAASGVDGEMGIFIVFTLRDGKIAVLEWFPDHDSAVAAAGGN